MAPIAVQLTLITLCIYLVDSYGVMKATIQHPNNPRPFLAIGM